MSKLIAGIIGCGAFARSQHLPNSTASGKVQIKWACDLFPEVYRKAQEDFNIPNGTTSPDDLFNDPEVDLVILATSHEIHLELIQAAAKTSKHIMCEKPMAQTLEEANKIVRLVRQSGIKMCVDLNRRCSSAMHDLKKEYLDFKTNPQHNPWRYTEMKRPPLRRRKSDHTPGQGAGR